MLRIELFWVVEWLLDSFAWTPITRVPYCVHCTHSPWFYSAFLRSCFMVDKRRTHFLFTFRPRLPVVA